MNNISPWNSQAPVENSQPSFNVPPLMFLYHQEKTIKNQNVGRTMTDDVARNLQVCYDAPKVFCKSNIVHPYPAVIVPIQYVKVTVEIWQKNPDAYCQLSADEQRVHMIGNQKRVAIAHRLKPPKHLGKKGPKMRIIFIGEDSQGDRDIIGESEDLVVQAKIGKPLFACQGTSIMRCN